MSPTDKLLRSPAVRKAAPAVRAWLAHLLRYGERASSVPPLSRPPFLEDKPCVQPKSKSRTAMPDTYFSLVKAFPLAHIRDDAHLITAREVMERLLEKDLDAGEDEYLDALTDLIEAYEDEHVKFRNVSDVELP